MPGQLPISLLSALVWGQVSKALVPRDPTITPAALLPRQNDDSFIGYVEMSGTWITDRCQEGTWYEDGTYAQCCPTTLASCVAPTACVDGNLIYPYADLSTTLTIPCTENFGDPSLSVCNTAFIYENWGNADRQTDIVCGTKSEKWSYYRSIPASVTEKSTSGPTTTPSPPPSPTPLPAPQEKEKSKAWIAGAVVGPILGIAIIAAIVFFCLRRRNKKIIQGPAGAAVGSAPVPQYADETKPQFASQGSYGQPAAPFNPHDSYNPYGQQPLSPAPQYSTPYNPPGSPPPQGHYAAETKETYQHVDSGHPQVAELGSSHPPAVISPPAASHTAELGGGSSSNPPAASHTAELSGESHN